MRDKELVGVRFPREVEKAVLSLPVLDLLSLDKPERTLLLKVPQLRLRRILSVNPFFKVVPVNKPFPRSVKVLDLARALDRRLYRGKDPLWKRAIRSARSLVRTEALEYFLSGPFPRNCIWFGPEEYDYISLISELTGGRYVVLAIDVRRMSSYWSIYRWIELVHRIITRGDMFVLISSNDNGKVAETISGLYRSRSLSISYRSYYKYVLALLSKARVVVGNDLEQVFLAAYLRNGTIGLVQKVRDAEEFRLWEEENYVVHEVMSPSFLVREIYSLAARIEAKLTREEKGSWTQPWTSNG